jgi:hypothetical protein
MAISQQLMTALLSMDSYNRGYNEGIRGLGGAGSEVGNATMLSVPLPTGSQTSGFYASAYSWNGKTIISYRGTSTETLGATGLDVLTGWLTGGDTANDNMVGSMMLAA